MKQNINRHPNQPAPQTLPKLLPTRSILAFNRRRAPPDHIFLCQLVRSHHWVSCSRPASWQRAVEVYMQHTTLLHRCRCTDYVIAGRSYQSSEPRPAENSACNQSVHCFCAKPSCLRKLDCELGFCIGLGPENRRRKGFVCQCRQVQFVLVEVCAPNPRAPAKRQRQRDRSFLGPSWHPWGSSVWSNTRTVGLPVVTPHSI